MSSLLQTESNLAASADWRSLAAMIAYRRPNGSKTERKFINRFIRNVPGMVADAYGNYMCEVGGPSPRIMFCAHTDTVHKQGGKQTCKIDTTTGAMRVDDKASNCLGADNTAGVWILLELIKAGIPGLYVFHRAEEVGGLGSGWIATNTPHILEGIEIAIAFDRRGTSSVITHQWGSRTCSDAFADSFIEASGLNLKRDDGGTFTDTQSYCDIVPECTNISVGFNNEHTPRETLDVFYLGTLLDKLLTMDWTALKAVRDPLANDPDDWLSYKRGVATRWGHGAYCSGDYGDDGELYDFPASSISKGHGKPRPPSMVALVESYPTLVADILEQYGYTSETLADELSTIGAGQSGSAPWADKR